jgi:hypothetical protein
MTEHQMIVVVIAISVSSIFVNWISFLAYREQQQSRNDAWKEYMQLRDRESNQRLRADGLERALDEVRKRIEQANIVLNPQEKK